MLRRPNGASLKYIELRYNGSRFTLLSLDEDELRLVKASGGKITGQLLLTISGGAVKEQDVQSSESEYSEQSVGKTSVAPEVLLTIARLTTLKVTGVSRMANLPPGVSRLFQCGSGDGVYVDLKDNTALIDLYVVLKQDVNIREVCRTVQHEVARAISEMVGILVGRINVHVEDIDYNVEQSQGSATEA